ncbi:MAG: AAA-type ATPase lid domain-containing protein, partial [Burkholderiales bacterium]
LSEEVKGGAFRQDLYYRLNVIELRMPSLREMREDIPALAKAILARQCAGREPPLLAGRAQSELVRYDFPGNVRELENILERALALATGEEIAAEDLQLAAAPAQAVETVDTAGLPLQELLDAVERKKIMQALEQTHYNRTAAAKVLGITFRALRYRMDRLGIKDELDAKS